MRMTSLYDIIEKEIARIVNKSHAKGDPMHSLLTLKWANLLLPDASEELKIAAMAHDIERAVYPATKQRENESYDSYKQRHAKRSADITAKLMRRIGYDKALIEAVSYLVSMHEVGGDDEHSQLKEQADSLRDADSIAYFEFNLEFYLERDGVLKSTKKAKYMYERASERARGYIDAIKYKLKPKAVEILMSVIMETREKK